MKLLDYDLIKSYINNKCDEYAIARGMKNPSLLADDPDDAICVLINQTDYQSTWLTGYNYSDNPKSHKFIIYYPNSRTLKNRAPDGEVFTFELNKTYIYLPIKQSDLGDNLPIWILRGKFIDYETNEIIGYDYKYNGPLY